MDNTLTARLYEERKIRLNLTQQQVADKAKLTLNDYRKYETGEKEMTIEFLQAIYYAGIDIQYVLTGYLSKNTYDDELQKRETIRELAQSLKNQPIGGLRIISDNETYQPFDLDKDSLASELFEVCGEVIEISHEIAS